LGRLTLHRVAGASSIAAAAFIFYMAATTLLAEVELKAIGEVAD
jgi:hypothetical protein